MTAAARRPATKRATPVRAAPAPAEPRQDTDEAVVDEDRVELFNVNGRSYTIPARPKTNLLVKYLWKAKDNSDSAVMQLLEDLAGRDALYALVADEDLTPETFQQIAGILHQVAINGLRPATGN